MLPPCTAQQRYRLQRYRLQGYTLEDSRHSVAVRMREKGYAFEASGAELGTSVYQLAKVYGISASAAVETSS